MNVTLTRVTYRPVDAIEEAASNCYDSEPSGGRIMKACYRSGHHSVLEFAQFTFHITGVSRALLAQLTRHRIASFAVRSQRYCSEDGFEYVIPPSIKENENALELYKQMMESLDEGYHALSENFGIPNEDARFILPNACTTTLEISMNGRELIHFFNERMCTRAQWEIRALAYKMKICLEEEGGQCAEFAKFARPKCKAYDEYTGMCPEHNSCGMSPTITEVLNDYNFFKPIKRHFGTVDFDKIRDLLNDSK